jgi:hypothetical protein
MKIIGLFALALAVSGCSALSGSKSLPGNVSVAYSVNPAGSVSYVITSSHCGVLSQGTVQADPAIAACYAINEGTRLVGTVATPSAPVAQ